MGYGVGGNRTGSKVGLWAANGQSGNSNKGLSNCGKHIPVVIV
jgi:hypothetical protein